MKTYRVMVMSGGQWVTVTQALDVVYARGIYDRTILRYPDQKVKLVEEVVVEKVIVDNYSPVQPC